MTTDELRALSDAATPGEWASTSPTKHGVSDIVNRSMNRVISSAHAADAAFIAAAVSHVRAMLAAPPAPTLDAAWAAVEAERMARTFHEAYERLAPDFGYQTRKDSAVPWHEVPERNRLLMVATCEAVKVALAAALREGRE